MLTVFAPTNKSSVCAENAMEDLWKMSGRADALHGHIARVIAERMAASYCTSALPDELASVCAIMGFDDLLAIKKESEGKPE